MAKQLTAPGCTYTIVARVDTTIYSPDQKWTLDIPAGQTDFIAETNEIIIPGDAMMCRKTHRVSKDLARVNLLGKGSGSLATFVARAIEQIVGKGNVIVTYGDGKLTVGLNSSVIAVQIAVVENLLEYVLPKDVVLEIDSTLIDYIRAEFLESTGTQYVMTGYVPTIDFGAKVIFSQEEPDSRTRVVGGVYRPYFVLPRYYAGSRIVGGWGFSGVIYINNCPYVSGKHTSLLNYKNSRLLEFDDTTKHPFIANWVEGAGILPLFAYNDNNLMRFIGGMRIYDAVFTMQHSEIGHYVPTIDPTGKPCMYDHVTRQSFYNSGTGQFIVGMTVEQALNLSKLPVTENGTLTVSLPWEAQWDTGVQNVLTTASTKGWTITVQYRDPEVVLENIPVSFLESTGTQYIDTGEPVQLEQVFEATIQVTETSNSAANYMFGGSSAPNLAWAFGTWGTGVPAKNWGYAQGGDKHGDVGLYSTLPKFEKMRVKLQRASVEVHVGGELLSLALTNPTSSTEGTRTVYLFGVNYLPPRLFAGKIYNFVMTNTATAYKFEAVAAIYKGVPCMYDRVSGQPFYNGGDGQFIAGFDTVEQARNLAYLPDVTAETDAAKKSLTVSLPWEAQLVITGVPAALQVAADRGWTITVQYRDPEADNAYYNKYAACETVADMRAVNADYKNDLTAEGEWIYELSKLTDGTTVFHGSPVKSFPAGFAFPSLTKVNSGGWDSGMFRECNVEFSNPNAFPVLTNADRMFHQAIVTLPEDMDFSHVTTAVGMFNGANLQTYTFPGVWTALQNATHLTRNSTRSQFSRLNSGFPSLQTGLEMFPYSQFDKESALLLLTSLPAYTSGAHPLQVGIHVDHQIDEDVVSAIAEVEAKGWTLTVRWNGTATAQAASTFGMRQPVFARLGEPLEDGTPTLDWGHYVTNWEQNGYQEFSSVEEAEEHFNINQSEEV